MAGQFVLLDIGGSYIKSATSDSAGNLSNVVRFPVPSFLSSQDKEREISLFELSSACSEAINFQFLKLNEKPKGILVSGQMAGYAISDTSCNPIGHVISWQDLRVEKEVHGKTTWEWAKTNIPSEVKHSLGNEYRVNLPLLNIAHRLRAEEFTDYSQIKFNSLLWWSIYPLLSKVRDRVHVTDAASSGLFDIQNQQWFENIYREFELTLEFPEVTSKLSAIGLYLDTSVPVFTPIGDQQASLLGTRISSTRAIVNIGTGGQVARILQENESSSDYPDAQIRPFFDSQFLVTVTHLPSGRAFARAVHAVTGSNNETDFDQFRKLCLSLGEVVPLPLEIFPYEPNKVEQLVRELGKEKFARSFLDQLVKIYSRALTSIGFDPKVQTLCFAGGVGQKFPELTSKLTEFTKANSLISTSEETTLEGLASLTSQMNLV